MSPHRPLPPWTPTQPGVSKQSRLAIVRGAGGAATSQTHSAAHQGGEGRQPPTPDWGLPASKPCSAHPQPSLCRDQRSSVTTWRRTAMSAGWNLPSTTRRAGDPRSLSSTTHRIGDPGSLPSMTRTAGNPRSLPSMTQKAGNTRSLSSMTRRAGYPGSLPSTTRTLGNPRSLPSTTRRAGNSRNLPSMTCRAGNPRSLRP